MSEKTSFEGWAILELMGHRRLAGFLSEQVVAGASFLRLDIHAADSQAIVTQFYAPQAVYCMTPTTEKVARAMGSRLQPQPVHAYELEPPRHDADDGGY